MTFMTLNGPIHDTPKESQKPSINETELNP